MSTKTASRPVLRLVQDGVPVRALQKNITMLESRKNDAWAKIHLEAWRKPRPDEEPLKLLIVGLSQYGTRHLDRYDSLIGDDCILGPAFHDMVCSVLSLLDGHIGRFDGGTLDSLLRAIAEENAIELEP